MTRRLGAGSSTRWGHKVREGPEGWGQAHLQGEIRNYRRDQNARCRLFSKERSYSTGRNIKSKKVIPTFLKTKDGGDIVESTLWSHYSEGNSSDPTKWIIYFGCLRDRKVSPFAALIYLLKSRRWREWNDFFCVRRRMNIFQEAFTSMPSLLQLLRQHKQVATCLSPLLVFLLSVWQLAGSILLVCCWRMKQ